ncbi:MAG: fibronectin type III domain-containing protein [Pseudomonadota bacterium]
MPALCLAYVVSGIHPAQTAPSGGPVPVPLLLTPPEVSGGGQAGSTLSADLSDQWSYGGAPATVTARDYRLVIGGAVADGPSASGAVTIPGDAAGAVYSMDMRVTLAEGGGVQSGWIRIGSGTVAPALNAPALAISTTLLSRVVTISVDSATGNPPPTARLTALTRDGVDILGEVTGTGPWSYVVPPASMDQTIQITVTAENGVGTPALETAEITVPADLHAPAQMAAPTLSVEGTTITATFLAPADGDMPITRFDLRHRAGATWTEVTGISDPHDLADLPEQTDHEVQMRAVNAAGAGLWSASASIRTGEAPVSLSLSATADGEAEIITDPATGLVEITIDMPSIYAGTYSIDPAGLATGPINLVPPQISTDGSPEVGETLTRIPGLWIYNAEAGGLQPPALQWLANNQGNAPFADIAEAMSDQYLLTEAEGGDDVLLREVLTDAFGSQAVDSTPVSVPVAIPPIAFHDDFTGYDAAQDILATAGWTAEHSNATRAADLSFIAHDGGGRFLATPNANNVRHFLIPDATLNDDHYIEIVYQGASGTYPDQLALCLRYLDPVNHIRILVKANGSFGGVDVGAGGNIAGGLGGKGSALVPGDVIRAEVIGTTLSVQVNGTPTGVTPQTTITTGNRVALHQRQKTAAGATYIDIDSIQVDNS